MKLCVQETSNSFVSTFCQDSSKIEALIKEGEESTNLIPKLEDNIPKLQNLLLDEEKILEEITEISKGGLFSFLLIYFQYIGMFF